MTDRTQIVERLNVDAARLDAVIARSPGLQHREIVDAAISLRDAAALIGGMDKFVYTELQMEHARKQSHADGFQTGWHAALKRVSEGDRTHDLRELIPDPPAADPAPRHER